MPPALATRLEGRGYTHDPPALREAAADVPEEVVDAVTLAGPPDEAAAGAIRLGRSGITQFMLCPLAVDGRVETTIERFQREVMPIGSGSRAVIRGRHHSPRRQETWPPFATFSSR